MPARMRLRRCIRAGEPCPYGFMLFPYPLFLPKKRLPDAAYRCGGISEGSEGVAYRCGVTSEGSEGVAYRCGGISEGFGGVAYRCGIIFEGSGGVA